MSNNYSMEYGYPSLIYPARMFKTREDAEAFDATESRNALCGSIFTKYLVECIASGQVIDADQENVRVVLAAMRWVANAADDAERENRMAEWRKQEEASAVQQAAE
jgi:hypothetical protein